MKAHHILLVEDQIDVRRMLRSGLESLGESLQVVDVPSGEEASLVSSRQPVDLLVSDVRLAGISGLELVNKIRRNHPDLKVVIITGLTDPEIRQQVTRLGAQAYFFKPIPMAAFLESVAKILGLEGPLDLATVSLPPTMEPPNPRKPEKILRDFQERVGARSLIALDDQGQVIQMMGEGIDAAQFSALAQTLLAGFQGGQAMLAPAQDGNDRGAFYYGHPAGDLCLAKNGQGVVLGVLVDRPARLDGESLVAATLDCAAQLANSPHQSAFMGTGEAGMDQPTEPSPPESLGATEAGIEDLFDQSGAQEMLAEDVDAFWDSATQVGEMDAPGEGTMDYQQARQLGLTPGDGEKKE